VGGRGDDVGVRDGVEVTGEDLPGDHPGEVGNSRSVPVTAGQTKKKALTCDYAGSGAVRRRPESNRCTGLCRPSLVSQTPWSRALYRDAGSGLGAAWERNRGNQRLPTAPLAWR
jgi:hypothetical protein